MRSHLLLLLAIIIPIFESLRIRATSISCTSDAQICQNPVCKLKALNRYEQLLQIGCPSQTTVPSSWMLIENLRKSSSGYQPGFLRSRLDFCAMLNRESVSFKLLKSILDNFGAGIMQQLDQQWLSCPLASAWFVNITLDERQNIMGPVASVVPAGEYRVRLWIHRKRTNQTVYEWTWNFNYSKGDIFSKLFNRP